MDETASVAETEATGTPSDDAPADSSILELSGFLGKPIEEISAAVPTSLEWEKTYNKYYRGQDENGNILAVDTENGICYRIYSSLPDTSVFQIEPKTSTAEEVFLYFRDNGFEINSSLSDSSSYYAVSESTGITVIVKFNQEGTVRSVTINN